MTEPASAELRLVEIVLTAADLDGAERESYLSELAVAEPELAAEARCRLAAAEGLSDEFLEIPAALRLATTPAGESEGEDPAVESVPRASAVALPAEERYELGECLGEGGMGRVFKAFDRQLGRTVALKLLTHEDPEVVRLFLGEARAQARIRHDHVLEIYDSGAIGGQPFISMQYVAGGTLAEVGAGLPLEGKVRLLAQAAEGLHAAHREGLLHRDVKPSNILVDRTADGELEARVTDFGLAVEFGDASDLAADAVAGSPHYIAPERLAGSPAAVDRRSDVYSLGVTMYRLLTGELPFAGPNTVAILRQVAHHELPPPRQRMPSLPVELEAVILRCLAREPEQRYASARAVAADLERYLAGEVVEAYAAGLAYRLTRFALRNKLLVGMAGAAVVALAVASVAVAVFALRADAARGRAELRQGQAEELIRFVVVDLRKRLDALGRLDVLDEVGKAAQEYFAAVPEEELSEAELERRSQVLYQIGEVRIKAGNLAGAVAPMQQSLALARRLAALAPDDGERLFALGQSEFWYGYVHWEQGELAAAREPFEAYLEISKRLVEKDPANLAWRRELSYAHSNLGSLRQAEGDLEGALEQFQATLEIDQELAAADPGDRDARSELAASHNTVGVALQDLGRLTEAGEHLQADLEIRQALVAETLGDPSARDFLGGSHGRLGIQLSMLGDWPGAGKHFQAQHEIFNELVAHDPANTTWQFRLIWSHLELTRVALARGDLATADAFSRLACRAISELLALNPTHVKWRWTRAVCLHHRALLEKLHGDAVARGTAFEAVEVFEAVVKAQPTDRLIHRWLSKSLLLLGSLEPSPAAADATFRRAEAAIAPFARGSRDPRMLAPWTTALICLGRIEEARPRIEELEASGYSEPELVNLCSRSKPKLR